MSITSDAAVIYDDFNTTGSPASGKKKPSKAAIRGLFAVIDNAISAYALTTFQSRAVAAAAAIAISVTAITIAPSDANAFVAREISNPGTLQGYHFTTNAGSRWWQIIGRDLTIEAFNAKGDGVTDDYPAMLAARTYFTLLGGGRLTFQSNKTYVCNAAAVNWNIDNLTVESVGGRAIILRTAIVNQSAIWEVRALSASPPKSVYIRNFKFVHTDQQHAVYTATAGQVNFAAPFGSTSNFDYIVFKNGTLLQSQSGDYNYSGGNIVLGAAAALNDVVIIKRTSASGRSAALLNEGFSFSNLSNDVRFENIEVESDGSLYVGVVHLWARTPVSKGINVKGVANRGHYRYGRLIDGIFDEIRIDGLVVSGPLASGGKRVTDYGTDANAYDFNNSQTGCWEGTVASVNCFRGSSVLGGMVGCIFGDYTYNAITTYGFIVQDSVATSATERVTFKSISGLTANNIAIWLMCSQLHIGYINVTGSGGYSVYCSPGSSGASESDVSIARCVISSGASIGAYFQAMLYLRVDSLTVLVCTNTGLFLDGCQYCDIGATLRNNGAGGVLLNSTCFSNSLRVQAIVNTGVGVTCQAGSSFNTIEGRSASNTTQLSNLGTNNDTARLR
jgi:hypothetical protein